VDSYQSATKALLAEKLVDLIRIMKGVRGSRNSETCAFGLYVVFTGIFIFSYSLPVSPLVAAIRLASGFCAVILLPGVFLSHCVLPERLQNLGTSILLGLMLVTIETHLLFTLTLATNLQVPLVLWICAINTLAVATCFVYSQRSSTWDLFRTALCTDCNRRLLLVATLALVLRLALLCLAQESIAPDASLYADYARGIIEGNFQSSVLNDGAVNALSSNVDYLTHQAFTYVFAVSWLLLPPTTSGPTLLLALIGVALLFPTCSIVSRFFGPTAAICVAFIVAVHPIFVFHSSVAYGPEITSLLFIVCGILFFVEGRNLNPKVLLAAGLLIGLTDVIWYANFYVICVTLPAILILLKMLDRKESLVFSVMMLLVIHASAMYQNIVVFFVSWTILFAVLALAQRFRLGIGFQRFTPFFIGIASVTFLWSWPLRMAVSYSASSSTPEDLIASISALYTIGIAFLGFWIALLAAIELVRKNKISTSLGKAVITIVGAAAVLMLWIWLSRIAALSSNLLSPRTVFGTLALAIVSPLSAPFLLSFVSFLFFHITPALLCLIPLALVRGRNRSTAFAFLATGLLAAGGTLKVLSVVSGSLGSEYLFSDSRFFLFVVLMCIISLGGCFAKLATSIDGGGSLIDTELHVTRRRWKCILVFSLIMVGFVPSYLAMPSGLALVNMEERYAWSGLPSIVNQLGDDNTVFLVDRAREFSWFTGRKTAVLELSNLSLRYTNASQELLSLAARFSTDYLIVDGYTVAHWKTLDFLLLESISLGTPVILGGSEIVEGNDSGNTFPALTLIAETQPDEFGDYSRVFRFDTSIFSRSWNVSLLDVGWDASNGGSIVNASGEVLLTIGTGQTFANTWRPDGFDLNLAVNSGFLLFDLEEISATITRIEVWDGDGMLLRHAESLGGNLYYCPLGEVTVGDIRIVIEGSSGESIIIRSISVWQVENH